MAGTLSLAVRPAQQLPSSLSAIRSTPLPVPRVPLPVAAAHAYAATVAAASAARGWRRHGVHCYATGTQEGRDRRTAAGPGSTGSGPASNGWDTGSSSSSSKSGNRTDPLLRSIAQCSTARELHQLLLRHSGELGGREVAAALEVAAKRKLVQPTPNGSSSSGGSSSSSSSPGGSSSGGGGGNDGGLGVLLVQLADKFAPVMAPVCLSAAAWSLAALQLAPARPVMRRMHELAERHITSYSPSQLCALLWAGGSLDPGTHSPLFLALVTLVNRGMGLALFSSHDLAALVWLCGREGGTAARDIVAAVADECRERIQLFMAAQQAVHGRPASRQGRRKKEVEGEDGDVTQAEAAAAAAAAAAEAAAVEAADATEAAAAEQEQQGQAQGAEGAQQLPGGLPPPPFRPAEAAMLLTGLAQLQLRVGGVVEPLLRQCEAQIAEAEANDVARIVIALGELMMDVGNEVMNALLWRLCAVEAQLSPQQVASALWACVRLGKSPAHKLSSMCIRHYSSNHARYSTVDTIGLLWGLAHLHRMLPDETLVRAVRAVQPEVGRCSTAGLCNLVWSLGQTAEMRVKTRVSWLTQQPAGLEAVALADLAAAELARRAGTPDMKTGDLATAASALAVHPPLAAALRNGRSVAVLREACAAAAAADDLHAFDVAQLATAAARLRWTERTFLDTLARAIQVRVNLSLTTSEVFSQSVWALASLAPSRYDKLFASLATAYAAKMQHPERLPAHLAGFQPEERSTVLSAFAAVAQSGGLASASMLEVLSSVSPMELRHLPITDAVPLLLLAAEAGMSPDAPVVQGCLKTIKRSFPRISPPSLHLVYAALTRLGLRTSPVALLVEQHLARLEQQAALEAL